MLAHAAYAGRCAHPATLAGMLLNEETGHLIQIGKGTYTRLGACVRVCWEGAWGRERGPARPLVCCKLAPVPLSLPQWTLGTWWTAPRASSRPPRAAPPARRGAGAARGGAAPTRCFIRDARTPLPPPSFPCACACMRASVLLDPPALPPLLDLGLTASPLNSRVRVMHATKRAAGKHKHSTASAHPLFPFSYLFCARASTHTRACGPRAALKRVG